MDVSRRIEGDKIYLSKEDKERYEAMRVKSLEMTMILESMHAELNMMKRVFYSALEANIHYGIGGTSDLHITIDDSAEYATFREDTDDDEPSMPIDLDKIKRILDKIQDRPEKPKSDPRWN